MGVYLQLLNIIRKNVLDKDYPAATNNLYVLLNNLKADYKKSTNPQERQMIEKTARDLIGVYNEVKEGRATDYSYIVLKIEKNNAPASQPEAPKPAPREEAPKAAAPTPAPAPAQPQPQTGNGAINAKQKSMKKPLTPLTFDDYIGQEKAKKILKIAITAAKKENRVLQHILINSGYGLGKTTLANIIANEMGLPFFEINATNLKDAKSLSLYFSKITEPCIIFIDEIHTLKKEVQTVLLSILTDYHVSFIDDQGNTSSFDVPPFTLVGATTQAGELLKPFINRFVLIELLDYTKEEKIEIVNAKIKKLKLSADEDAIEDIALRSRGIPRTIETYLKGINDYCLSCDETRITKKICDEYFDLNDIDVNGLINNDIKVLKALASSDRPLALITIESKTGIQREDIEYRYEPFLIKNGLMEKTDRGRTITEKGLQYLKAPFVFVEGQQEEPEEQPSEEPPTSEEVNNEEPESVEEAPTEASQEEPAPEEPTPAEEEGDDGENEKGE